MFVFQKDLVCNTDIDFTLHVRPYQLIRELLSQLVSHTVTHSLSLCISQEVNVAEFYHQFERHLSRIASNTLVQRLNLTISPHVYISFCVEENVTAWFETSAKESGHNIGSAVYELINAILSSERCVIQQNALPDEVSVCEGGKGEVCMLGGGSVCVCMFVYVWAGDRGSMCEITLIYSVILHCITKHHDLHCYASNFVLVFTRQRLLFYQDTQWWKFFFYLSDFLSNFAALIPIQKSCY